MNMTSAPASAGLFRRLGALVYDWLLVESRMIR